AQLLRVAASSIGPSRLPSGRPRHWKDALPVRPCSLAIGQGGGSRPPLQGRGLRSPRREEQKSRFPCGPLASLRWRRGRFFPRPSDSTTRDSCAKSRTVLWNCRTAYESNWAAERSAVTCRPRHAHLLASPRWACEWDRNPCPELRSTAHALSDECGCGNTPATQTRASSSLPWSWRKSPACARECCSPPPAFRLPPRPPSSLAW